MVKGRIIFAVVLAASLWCARTGSAQAQEPATIPVSPVEPDPVLTHRSDAQPKAPPPQTVSLTVPKGTPLQVVLDKEVKIGKVGQPIHGRTAEPVYAFDKMVVPVGCDAISGVTYRHGSSNGKC